MDPKDKVIVITGGGSGIGKAVAQAFARKGGKLVIADISMENAEAVANEVGGHAFHCDVCSEDQIKNLVKFSRDTLGPVDLFFSNAGLGKGEGEHSASASNETWQLCWDIHVMSHVYAARALLPDMIKRGDGYLLQMASAAGMLSQIGDAAYSATKHAAVGFAESLAITHGDDGIKVSVVCPQYVATPLLGYDDESKNARSVGTITADEAALTIVDGVKSEAFLILTHPEVRTYFQHKAADTDRWIGGMRRLRKNILDGVGGEGTVETGKFL